MNSLKLRIAKNIVLHIRRAFLSLLNGEPSWSKRQLGFWINKFDNSSKYWNYPIINNSIRQDCASLGVTIGNNISNLSGVHQLVAFLQAVEKPLRDILSEATACDCSVLVNKEIEPTSYENSGFEIIPEVFETLKKKSLPGISLFLHGSMADHTYTAYSDVDDLVIVESSAWKDPKSLMNSATLLTQLSREYQNIDPLQHHGHWVVTEFDLLLYDQNYMPLIVLDEAIRIIGKPEIKFRLITDLGGFIDNARLTIQAISQRIKVANQKGGISAFDLKCLVGEIALLPAYIFQSRGNMLSKPEAISKAGELYTVKALKALQWSTKVRNEFAPLVNNRRTNTIKNIAKLTCYKRNQAQNIHKKWSYWVSAKNSLGISPEIIETIKSFVEESNFLIKPYLS